MSSPGKSADMLRGPVFLVFLRYSLPWAMAMLLMSSAGIVDGFFIGRHVGPLALAGLNITMPVFSLLMGLGIVLASGGGVRCAHYRGKGQEVEACAIFTKTMMALLAVSTTLTLFCLPNIHGIVRMLGADETIAPVASEYLTIIVPFFPVFVLELGLAYFVRVDQRPTLASAALMGCAVINIVLDYVFIALCGWGVSGAAWATGIGYTAMLAMMVCVHLVWNSRPHVRFTRQWGKWKEIWQSAWNGISEMINEFSGGIVMLLTNIIMMQRVGAYGVAAFTVINYVNWVCLMLAYGISDSLAPLVSANHGAGNQARVQAFLRVALWSVGLLGVTCFILMSAGPRQLVEIFLPGENAATGLALDFMNIARFMFLFCGVNIVLTAYFTGMLQATASAMVALSRSLIFPLALLLTLPPLLGDLGIYLALPMAEAGTLLVAVALYRWLQRRARS